MIKSKEPKDALQDMVESSAYLKMIRSQSDLNPKELEHYNRFARDCFRGEMSRQEEVRKVTGRIDYALRKLKEKGYKGYEAENLRAIRDDLKEGAKKGLERISESLNPGNSGTEIMNLSLSYNSANQLYNRARKKLGLPELERWPY